ELEKISINSQEFYSYELKYVQPVIRFNSNLRTGASVDINYRFLNPEGVLIKGYDSPAGYTWNRSIFVLGNFSEENIAELTGFGLGVNPISGRYNVEIWCNGVLLGNSYFDIIDY